MKFVCFLFVLLHLPNCPLGFRSYSLVTTVELLTPSFIFIKWYHLIMERHMGPFFICFLITSPVWNMGERITCSWLFVGLYIYFCVFCFFYFCWYCLHCCCLLKFLILLLHLLVCLFFFVVVFSGRLKEYFVNLEIRFSGLCIILVNLWKTKKNCD